MDAYVVETITWPPTGWGEETGEARVGNLSSRM